jgi:hypothetical protein
MRDISLHIMDITQNSISGEASEILITLDTVLSNGFLILEISDNGKGMDKTLLDSVIDPFVTTRTTRNVGLGIPMLKASCERTGGIFKIDSKTGEGTTVLASFKIDNIDRIPLGDVTETIIGLIVSHTEIRFVLKAQSEKGKFIFDTSEIKETLCEVPINNLEVLDWIKGYLNEGVIMIFGGVLYEIHS